MKGKNIFFIWFVFQFLHTLVFSQSVIVIVVDGVRYSESFEAKGRYIPMMWDSLRLKGTIWTNIRNEGLTKTDPGHASIVTGTWQLIDNKGIQRPTQPTMFEYFRKATKASEEQNFVVVGKYKLDILTYSTHPEYGRDYKASISVGEDNVSVVNNLKSVLSQYHPRLVLVNLPDTDIAGHSGNWSAYLSAIRQTDSLIYVVWQTLQHDAFYYENTTLFIVNDHGRHDKAHGDIEKHGDSCEGCRHIMLLGIGRGVQANKVISHKQTQCDLVPTIGKLLSFPTIYAQGEDLLQAVSVPK